MLLCERALWPGEANAQPPVSSELIGGTRWDYAGRVRCLDALVRVGRRTIAGGGTVEVVDEMVAEVVCYPRRRRRRPCFGAAISCYQSTAPLCYTDSAACFLACERKRLGCPAKGGCNSCNNRIHTLDHYTREKGASQLCAGPNLISHARLSARAILF